MPSPFLAFAIRPFMQQRNARRLIITSADGIQERRYVTIGGIQQWVTIPGQERNNPVLLLIHGALAHPMLLLARGCLIGKGISPSDNGTSVVQGRHFRRMVSQAAAI